MARCNGRGPDSSPISPWVFVCTRRSLMDSHPSFNISHLEGRGRPAGRRLSCEIIHDHDGFSKHLTSLGYLRDRIQKGLLGNRLVPSWE